MEACHRHHTVLTNLQLFSALSETLHNQVRLVTDEKNGMLEEAQRIVTTIKQMEASLDDQQMKHQYAAEDENLKITYPLLRCLSGLKEQHQQVSKLHKERFEQVKSRHPHYTLVSSIANILQNSFKLSNHIRHISKSPSLRLPFHPPHQTPTFLPHSIYPPTM